MFPSSLATLKYGRRTPDVWCSLLVGGVPRSPNLWGDPQHPTVRVPRWQRSRQCPSGGYRGRSRSISSPRRGWGARTHRASSQNSRQTARRPHSPPPVTFSPRPCSLSLPRDGLCTTLVPYETLFVLIILSPAFFSRRTLRSNEYHATMHSVKVFFVFVCLPFILVFGLFVFFH